jgi:HTH-type transcriptional regulator, sugar sensing transcriptional regulator
MGQDQVLNTLTSLGLSRLDSQVYIYLSKKGPQKGKEISKALQIQKQQLYRSLKYLQSKGIVSSTIEHPARFSAVPFDKVVDIFIRTKMAEAQNIQANKDQILVHWKAITITEQGDAASKFNVIQGRGPALAKAAQMVTNAKSSVSIISSFGGLLRADQFGVFSSLDKGDYLPEVSFRLLVEDSKNNVSSEKLINQLDSKKKVELRIAEANLNLPWLVIRDDEEILFFINHENELETQQEDTCLWTDCKSLVLAFTAFFGDFWKSSRELRDNLPKMQDSNIQITATQPTFNREADTSSVAKDGKSDFSERKLKGLKHLKVKPLTIIATLALIVLVAAFLASPNFIGGLNNPSELDPTDNPARTTVDPTLPSSDPSVTACPHETTATFQTSSPTPTLNPTSVVNPTAEPVITNAKFYDTPQVAENGTQVSIPRSFVTANAIVNLDLKLDSRATVICYSGRTISLLQYREGYYLPLMILLTPSGQTLAVVRVCEPCHDYSFHIVNGKILECSMCQTNWNLEDLTGISGNCRNFPPPLLKASISQDTVTIDFSPTGLRCVP